MEDINDLDIYELLGIPPSADDRLIKKAYRKKALTCHPDKNPDNPKAAALFLELSKALETLLDKDKRVDYDKLYNAKKAAKIRHEALDASRKKFKEDLELRERQAQFLNKNSASKTPEQKLVEEIERLRKEGSRQLKEEMESLRQQINNEKLLKTKNEEIADDRFIRLKIRWKSKEDDTYNGGYDYEKLLEIFSKYGNVAAVIISKHKKGRGLIEFEKVEAAQKAYQLEQGYSHNPLILSWLHEKSSTRKLSDTLPNVRINTDNLNRSNTNVRLFPSGNPSLASVVKTAATSLPSDESDFEAFVFAKLREAQEKKSTN